KFVEGVAPIPVTASPFTYVNTDSVPEAVYIFGGSVNQVAKNSINLFTNTNVTVWLEPDESVTVSYSMTPSMAKDKKKPLELLLRMRFDTLISSLYASDRLQQLVIDNRNPV